MASLINLIPNSFIQFWTIDINLEKAGKVRRSFWEEPVGAYPDGSPKVVLRTLVEKETTGQLHDPVSGKVPPDQDIYQIGRKQILETLRERWVPLPYLRTESLLAENFDAGPSNWARGRLIERPGADGAGHYCLCIAFDTALQPKDPYAGPTTEDSQTQAFFALAHQPEDMGWFLNQEWVGDWLGQVVEARRIAERAGRRPRSDETLPALEHYAIYQTFLAMLGETGAMPQVQMLHSSENILVDVDLVLDLGNSRSCGILIEEHSGKGLNFSDSYTLKLRDLSHPEVEYADPFPSRVEFARASFGSDRLSRKSGREFAFSWPNPVRTGHEAERLAGSRIGNEGLTGLSSPKRYLWDLRPAVQGWRFNAGSIDGSAVDPPVNGPFRTMLSEIELLTNEDRSTAGVSGQAIYSRSLLFTFMLVELILQACLQMNSPQTRSENRDATRPRRLRSVLLTMPPGMPVAEQKIFRRRAEIAIELASRMQNTSHRPRLRAELDEATATQIVWLHNEITERLGGDVDAFFELYGRPRQGLAGPAVRVANIDIGGGTTDLMVTSYEKLESDALRPRQEFRESFKAGGDEILEGVITRVILPSIEAALAGAGAGDTRAILNRALAQDHAGQSAQDRHSRQLFVQTILEPAAIYALSRYEHVTDGETGELARFRLGDVVRGDPDQIARSATYLIRQAFAGRPPPDFDLCSIEVVVQADAIEGAVTHALGMVLSDLGEAVWSYDCDVLLLSGRPSRLRRIVEMVTAALPVAPHRLVPMYRYRVGSQYAFRDRLDRIDDPKTTVAVGAALFVQSQGRLQNFHLRTKELSMRSTARFIGQMDLTGQIRSKNVLLHNVDLDGPPSDADVAFVIGNFEGKMQLGFRQLPVERWPATPLYMIEFSSNSNHGRLALPLRLTLRRADIRERDEDANDFANREQFGIIEVEDAEGGSQHRGVVHLRLQTMPDADGYWRDTGRLNTL